MSTQAPSTPPGGGLQSGPTCPTCSAPLASDQRYCLNCGRRLTDPRVEYRQALRLEPSAPALVTGPDADRRDLRNALVVLVGMATIVLAVGVGIVIGRGDGSTGLGAKPTVVTVAGPAASPAPATSTPAATSTPSSAAKVPESWPTGASGWTVEVSSLSNATATSTGLWPRASAAEMADTGSNGHVPGGRLQQARDGLVAGLRRVGLAQPAPPPPPQPGPPGSSQAVDGTELEHRRAALAARFAELQWDLGGVAYEMASRDHFRLDALIARAAALQDVEASLAEAERLLKLDHAGAAGDCPSCGSLYARGADFCWHCGLALMRPAPNAEIPLTPDG